ncbi:MAG TPA: hypothetical protein VLJ57_09795 [Burkholderiaceae bacterium]|nr:hypothetical protein [Burkholderiaceae bacterium]
MSNSDANMANVVAKDGLRYKSKTSGSTFSGSGATMSCIKCGQHRSRSLLMTRRVAGRPYLACSPSCEALQAELNGRGAETKVEGG